MCRDMKLKSFSCGSIFYFLPKSKQKRLSHYSFSLLFLTTLSHYSFSLLFLTTLSHYSFSLLFLTTLSHYSFSLLFLTICVTFFIAKKVTKKSSSPKNSLLLPCNSSMFGSLARLFVFHFCYFLAKSLPDETSIKTK